ncbi:TraY domain-containing protein [uncultured Cedecea sp.]|uniref:TraY domain-containing protein n=1 Tax=uncultured Cedecea sp. TaxID=988762 RepID=UPI00260B0D5C|nr:TraY domain-containing protein [uncultured Cedecea sp.]
MSKNNSSERTKNTVSVYLDDKTHAILMSAKNRSGRTKSTEVAMRLKDHLRRFPNYLFSEKNEEVDD